MTRTTVLMTGVALTLGVYVSACSRGGSPDPKSAAAHHGAHHGPEGEHKGGPPRGPHHQPPAEAVAACEKLTVDAACSFQLPTHSFEGACHALPESGPVVCAPKDAPLGPPPGHHAGPPGRDDARDDDRPRARAPQEAVDACAKLAEGAACTVNIPARTIDGTCRHVHDQGSSVCAPKDMPRGPDHEAGPHGH